MIFTYENIHQIYAMCQNLCIYTLRAPMKTVKAYRTLYESVKYANPKYMFRKPELATPFSKFPSFYLAVRNWFLLSKWNVTRQLPEECFPLSAGGWGCRSSCKGQNIENQQMLSGSQHQTFLKKCYKVLITIIGGAIVTASRGSIIIGHLNRGKGHI